MTIFMAETERKSESEREGDMIDRLKNEQAQRDDSIKVILYQYY